MQIKYIIIQKSGFSKIFYFYIHYNKKCSYKDIMLIC